MGVVIHILDRRRVCLDVAGVTQEVGTLRHMSKVTEIDDKGSAEVEEAAKFSHGIPAAMVAQAVNLRLASGTNDIVQAHMVIGWDEGRGSVPDLGWDYLPVLGYGVKDKMREVFALHELCDGTLRIVDKERAATLGLVANETLVRRGQPTILECYEIRPYLPNFVEADCLLADGRRERILVRVVADAFPSASWLVGRTPMGASEYPSDDRRTG